MGKELDDFKSSFKITHPEETPMYSVPLFIFSFNISHKLLFFNFFNNLNVLPPEIKIHFAFIISFLISSLDRLAIVFKFIFNFLNI